MNNLFATWHLEGEVDLGAGSELDLAGLLTRAEARLAGIPELDGARRLVAAALADVSAWATGQSVRSTSFAGSTAPG